VTPTPDDVVNKDLLRELAPQVLGALMRRYGDFHDAEDAMQEALLAASVQWPKDGAPDDPRAWLIRVASRRITDQIRSEEARRRREDIVAEQEPVDRRTVPAAGAEDASADDDSLILLFMCCHPTLTPPSAIALTLRAVGGLTTAEIANAFFVPEATMAQRISRAKQKIKSSGARFDMPDAEDRAGRLASVLHVLYLIFNEGYTSSIGPDLRRGELSDEAIRLTRMVRAVLPDDAEVAGLLALMLLTDARRTARTDADGELIPLAEQDRSLWDKEAIEEGVATITQTLARGSVGPYQLQAAVAAVHDEAPSTEETDWEEILALYGVLERMSDNPMITLNRAIALAMVHGPPAGLKLLDAVEREGRLAGNHRLAAVRAHLLEQLGDRGAAIAHYRSAARSTTSIPEQHYLIKKAARLASEQTG
jgi:RNA polymerase sigma factor (sigma-70 family)